MSRSSVKCSSNNFSLCNLLAVLEHSCCNWDFMISPNKRTPTHIHSREKKCPWIPRREWGGKNGGRSGEAHKGERQTQQANEFKPASESAKHTRPPKRATSFSLASHNIFFYSFFVSFLWNWTFFSFASASRLSLTSRREHRTETSIKFSLSSSTIHYIRLIFIDDSIITFHGLIHHLSHRLLRQFSSLVSRMIC